MHPSHLFYLFLRCLFSLFSAALAFKKCIDNINAKEYPRHVHISHHVDYFNTKIRCRRDRVGVPRNNKAEEQTSHRHCGGQLQRIDLLFGIDLAHSLADKNNTEVCRSTEAYNKCQERKFRWKSV